jgi:glucose/arabinose dehydrogenase
LRILFLISFLSALPALVSCVPVQVRLKDAFPGLTFNRPVYVGQLPGVAGKTMVVLEQHLGEATLVFKQGDAWAKRTLLKIDVHQANEMGLLGIAFHPDFPRNHKYYIDYDPPGPDLANIIEERETDSSLMRDAGKARVLIRVPDKYTNHNGGTLAFGPKDGMLYIGMGDGGSGNDPDGNGQNRNVLLAKMLRIDVDRKDPGLEYGIPADNPFAKAGPGQARGEIWAYGLRNPWKWSFDPLTGDLWAGDVGQNAIEEVDLIVKGGNYGWSEMEGPEGRNDGSMILPVHSYNHGVGSCVIGGVVYRGNPASRFYGRYFFSDLSGHTIWTLRKNGSGKADAEKVGKFPADPTTFGTDSEGLIYAATLTEASPIYRLESPDLGPAPGGSAMPSP